MPLHQNNPNNFMDNQTPSPESIIISILSTLSPTQLSKLSTTLSSTFHHHQHRLASLLSSPTLFTHTLNHLYSLSLSHKSLLISRHFLSFLHLLTPFFPRSLTPAFHPRFRSRDLDSVLLLLHFCEIRLSQPKLLETSPVNWHRILVSHCSNTVLGLFAFPVSQFDILRSYIDILVKCHRFVSSNGCDNNPARKQMAASVAAVVALPSVAVKRDSGDVECMICKDEMEEGRDVCELPCQHLFHWSCVLTWLSRRNTCPCCRFQLPTDDVYGEIGRLWHVMLKLAH